MKALVPIGDRNADTETLWRLQLIPAVGRLGTRGWKIIISRSLQSL